MALDKLVDSAQLDACLEAEADAIRAKTGGYSDITFDYANSKGFADVIAAIETGGGGSSITQSSKYCDITVGYAIVTVGANNIVGAVDATTYLMSLSGAPSGANLIYAGIVSEPFYTNAEFLTTVYPLEGNSRLFYRYDASSGAPVSKIYSNSYDGKINEGSKYLVAWSAQSNWEVPA